MICTHYTTFYLVLLKLIRLWTYILDIKKDSLVESYRRKYSFFFAVNIFPAEGPKLTTMLI